MRIIGLCLLSMVIACSNAFAESETIFSGIPMTKISEGGISCVFRSIPATDSGGKPATDSGRSRPLIPVEVGHLIR